MKNESGRYTIIKKNEIFPPQRSSSVCGRYTMFEKQKKYFKTERGKEALNKARKKYDNENPEKRKEQKREYMRRRRLKDKGII